MYFQDISIGLKLSTKHKLTNNTSTTKTMFYSTDMEIGIEAIYLDLIVSQCNNKIHVKACC